MNLNMKTYCKSQIGVTLALENVGGKLAEHLQWSTTAEQPKAIHIYKKGK